MVSGPRHAVKLSGYTFIELLIVVGIAGILAAAAWPAGQRALAGVRLEQAARLAAGDLRFIQQQAINGGMYGNYGVRFNLNGDGRHRYCYWLVRGPTILRDVPLPEGIIFQAATFGPAGNSVNFTWDGTPSAGGTVMLSDRFGRNRYIIVSPVTGRVRVSQIPPEGW